MVLQQEDMGMCSAQHFSTRGVVDGYNNHEANGRVIVVSIRQTQS